MYLRMDAEKWSDNRMLFFRQICDFPYTYGLVRFFMCMCVCMCVCVYVYVCMCVCVCV